MRREDNNCFEVMWEKRNDGMEVWGKWEFRKKIWRKTKRRK